MSIFIGSLFLWFRAIFLLTPSFAIKTGKWKSVEKDKRICTLCIGNQFGDEKHYVLADKQVKK